MADDWLDAGTQAVLTALDAFDIAPKGDPTGLNQWGPGGQDPTGTQNWNPGYGDPTGLRDYRPGGVDPTGLGQFRRTGVDPTGLGSYRLSGIDPTGLGTWEPGSGVDPLGPGTSSSFLDLQLNAFANESTYQLAKTAEAQAQQIAAGQAAAQGQGTGTGGPPTQTPSGSMGNPTGGVNVGYGSDWGVINQWNPQIVAAIGQVAAETGVSVDGNRIKAHMMIESPAGDGCSDNTGGAMGLMQVTAQAYTADQIDWSRMGCVNGQPVDAAYQILAGVRELAARYAAPENTNPDKWRGASCSYFTGSFDCAYGHDSVTPTDSVEYEAMLNAHMAQLQAAAQQTYGGPAPGTAGPGGQVGAGTYTGYDSYLGRSANVGQPFNNQVGRDMYAYSADYGYPWGTHIGVDLGGNFRDPIYTPVAGTVVCVGSDNGPGTEGRGCGFFRDTDFSGAGRVEVLGDDGRAYIFGHSNQATVQLGQRVTAGQQVATMGGMSQATHLHMEVHQKCATSTSGWCAVDPATVYNGALTGAPAGQPTGTPAAVPAPSLYPGGSNMDIADFLGIPTS